MGISTRSRSAPPQLRSSARFDRYWNSPVVYAITELRHDSPPWATSNAGRPRCVPSNSSSVNPLRPGDARQPAVAGAARRPRVVLPRSHRGHGGRSHQGGAGGRTFAELDAAARTAVRRRAHIGHARVAYFVPRRVASSSCELCARAESACRCSPMASRPPMCCPYSASTGDRRQLLEGGVELYELDPDPSHRGTAGPVQTSGGGKVTDGDGPRAGLHGKSCRSTACGSSSGR